MSQSTVLIICVARVLLFLPFMTIAGCIPILIEEWNIGAAKVGMIVSGFYFTYAFSLFGFSWLSDHIGAKRAVLISAFTTGFSCVAFGVFARDFTSTLILYSFVGLFQGGVYTPVIMLFGENAPPGRLGTVIGWLIASTSIGYAASIGVTGASIGLSGWQLAFLATGLPPAAGAALLTFSIRRLPNVIHARAPGNGLWAQLRRNVSARRLLVGYTCHNWELIGMWSWAPAFLAASFVLSGATTVTATLLSTQFITILHLGGGFAAYSMGKLSDTLGRRTVLIWSAAVAAAFSLGIGWLVGVSPYLLALLVITYSFFAIGDSPVLSTAMTEEADAGTLGSLLALRSMTGFLAGAASPALVGWTIDRLRMDNAGDATVWGVSFAILGLGGLLAVWFAFRLPARSRLD
ncbi:MAG: MFS transporter [Hyphomicrobiaceae bacterium]|nr:MFS transporter [Hyphomicrobiaceae bacterium]